MSAARSLLTPDEQFIQEVLRSGRATRQDVSLKAIGIPDVSLQARVVHLDMDHCSRLERSVLDQGEHGDLAPVVLFRASNPQAKVKLFLADGHHRHHVYVNMLRPKRHSIPAYVIDSDAPEQEALEFATMCNREMCLGRSQEDITKAVEMLLMTELWRGRADTVIAHHVGCSNAKVTNIRSRLNLKMGWTAPEVVFRSDGKPTQYRQKRGQTQGGRTVSVFKTKTCQTSHHRASINGNRISGKSIEEVTAKVAEIQVAAQDQRHSLSRDAISRRLRKNGFTGIAPKSGAMVLPGLQGFHRPGIVCLPCDFSTPEVLPMVIGQLIAAQEYKEPTARMIVLCYVEDGSEAMLDLYRRKGFEFMTPDELVESLKA